MTSASCLENETPQSIILALGFLDPNALPKSRSKEDKKLGAQYRKASQIIIHEKYNAKKKLNDIALIVLQSPVKYPSSETLGTLIRPACLPRKTLRQGIFQQDYPMCFVAGYSISKAATNLQYNYGFLKNSTECQKSLNTSWKKVYGDSAKRKVKK